jgi:hypothetical protein
MTEWLAWVDVLDDAEGDDGSRVRRYVTHGVPFLQLTPFRSAAARYSSREVAQTVASFAADPLSPYGAEQAGGSLAKTRRQRPGASSSPGGTTMPRSARVVGRAAR